ncbi:MAG: hypothetical protein ABIJ86_14070 [Spirochaetota bacterium]
MLALHTLLPHSWVPDAHKSGAGSGRVPDKSPPPSGQTRPHPNRPQIRADCMEGPRPCPWIGCKWHMCWLRHDIRRLILGDGDPAEVSAMIMDLEESCTLDMAEVPQGERFIAAVLGVSHQAIGQTCQRAIAKLTNRPLIKRNARELDGTGNPSGWQWSRGTFPPRND